ncbi:MAG TPA: hypothetical protein VFH87_01740 [Candidatus Udaeobacter sp.]|nr:hypothetical protein [Candidatus Udaeobacter sp.]
MAKPKGKHPNQPPAYNMLTFNHQNGSSQHNQPQNDQQNGSAGPQIPCQDEDAYARLDDALRDFIFGISRGYSVRMACRMSGNDYEVMLDFLNNQSPYWKPDLFRLVEKARAVCYSRHVEALNAATDWHAHAFWLERREPKEYGRTVSLEEEGAQRRALIRMTPETLDALSEAYDAEHGTPSEERE